MRCAISLAALLALAAAAPALAQDPGYAGPQAMDRYGGGGQRLATQGPAKAPGKLRRLGWAGKSEADSTNSPPALIANAAPRPLSRWATAWAAPSTQAVPVMAAPVMAPPAAFAMPTVQGQDGQMPPPQISPPMRRPYPSMQVGQAFQKPFRAQNGQPQVTPPRAAVQTVEPTIYDPPSPQVAVPAPAPVETAQNSGYGKPRLYSVHREYGLQPDPTPIPPQFFGPTADLSEPPAEEPRALTPTQKAKRSAGGQP